MLDLFHLFVKLWVSGFTLLLNIKFENSGQSIFYNVAKQMMKEKCTIYDFKNMIVNKRKKFKKLKIGRKNSLINIKCITESYSS